MILERREIIWERREIVWGKQYETYFYHNFRFSSRANQSELRHKDDGQRQ